MGKTVVNMMEEILANGPKNTIQIHDLVNEMSHYGATQNEVNCRLAKNSQFEKLGVSRLKSKWGGTYTVCLWGLTEAFKREELK